MSVKLSVNINVSAKKLLPEDKIIVLPDHLNTLRSDVFERKTENVA